MLFMVPVTQNDSELFVVGIDLFGRMNNHGGAKSIYILALVGLSQRKKLQKYTMKVRNAYV